MSSTKREMQSSTWRIRIVKLHLELFLQVGFNVFFINTHLLASMEKGNKKKTFQTIFYT
jgi:hypothetical protein